jgi:histidinol-phosphate aminotransferase
MLGPGRTVVVPQPTFTLYKLQSQVLQANIVTAPLKAADFSFDVDAIISATRTADAVVICSPNNPTGALLNHKDLAAILQSTPGIVLLDEAYHEFSGQTALALLPEYKNLVVLRTFSKAMSMAGLRFGYMLAHPEIAREVHKAKLPYNVNIFTLTAAELVIERGGVMKDAIDTLVQERQRLFAELAKRTEIQAFPSCANFILFRTDRPARQLFDALYAQGILIRDVSSYPMLDRTLRVSVGKPEENTRFLAALDRALERG